MSYNPDYDLPTMGSNPLVQGLINFLNQPFVRAAIYSATAGLGITAGLMLAKRPEKKYKIVAWTSFSLSVILAVMALGMLWQGLFPNVAVLGLPYPAYPAYE